MKIKFLGHGAIVKTFINLYHEQFPDVAFEIYQRKPHCDHIADNHISFHLLQDYVSDASITICCLAVNEEDILRQSGSSSRLQVAKPNIGMITPFIEAGFFNSGTHFTLTNPCELIAEFIIKNTRNQHIYALGLSMDEVRYRQILPLFNINPEQVKFDIIGNHYQSPLINFHEYAANSADLISDLLSVLSSKIRGEFTGYKPPITGGVTSLYHAVSALYHQTEFAVSGFSKEYDAVAGGRLNPVTGIFHQPTANPAAMDLFLTAIETHKIAYKNVTGAAS